MSHYTTRSPTNLPAKHTPITKGESPMAQQQQMSNLAKKLGARLSAANEATIGKPVDTGTRRLPPGIREGIARLSTMYTKDYTEGALKGESFFRASAIVVYPEMHNGEKVSGAVTSVMVSLCDIKAEGDRKAKSFEENFKVMRDTIMSLGIAECKETKATDPTGERTWAYWQAAMQMLTDQQRAKTNPVYVQFSTRGWTPPAKPGQPKPEERVIENWHGLATPEQVAKLFGGHGKPDPASAVQESNGAVQSVSTDPPPAPTFDEFAPSEYSLADEVGALVATATQEEGEDAQAATMRLQELAIAAGWSKEQVDAASDWAQVGDMALSGPSEQAETPILTVGSRWMYSRRTKDGTVMKDKNGKDFPAVEVEVTSLDNGKQTCTIKTTKDNKPVLDVFKKNPAVVKWEWLEAK